MMVEARERETGGNGYERSQSDAAGSIPADRRHRFGSGPVTGASRQARLRIAWHSLIVRLSRSHGSALTRSGSADSRGTAPPLRRDDLDGQGGG